MSIRHAVCAELEKLHEIDALPARGGGEGNVAKEGLVDDGVDGFELIAGLLGGAADSGSG